MENNHLVFMNEKKSLRPIGTEIVSIIEPSERSNNHHFLVVRYRVEDHVVSQLKIHSNIGTWTEKLSIVSTEQVQPTVYIHDYCGKAWWLPPKELWNHVTGPLKDLVTAWKAGVIPGSPNYRFREEDIKP